MQNSFQPEENQTPQTAYLPVAQTAPVTETTVEAPAAPALTERLNLITRRAIRTKRWFFGSFIAAEVWIIFTYIVLILRVQGKGFSAVGHFLFNLSLVLIPLAAMLLIRQYGSPKFNPEELAKLGGVQAIPALFAALGGVPQGKQRQAICSALTMLLPQMKASDAHLLTPAARRIINRWLQSAINAVGDDTLSDALRIAALKALEQVGDATAVPVVEHLAEMWPPLSGKRSLQQAAIDCLPMLRANCGEVETARTLLRASQPEQTAPGTLLRPASGAAQTNPAELLRGAEPPDAKE